MVDVLCAEPAQTGRRVHTDVAIRAGGSAVNAAFAAAEARARASVIGRIGDDAAGGLALRELEARGIDAVLARDPELPTGAAVVFRTDPPSVVADRGANAEFGVDDVPASIDTDALFVSGFALFQSGSSEAASAAIDRFGGGVLGIDVGAPGLAEGARDLRVPSGKQTVLFATAEEARALTGSEPEGAARLLAASYTVVCIKLGAEGAIAVSEDTLDRRRADAVERTSPFGAGDAFAGTFLVALAEGVSVGEALGRACTAGAEAAGRGLPL